MKSLCLAKYTMAAMAVTAFAADHPSVYINRQDVARARERMRSGSPHKAAGDEILKAAAEWLKKDDAWLRAAVPKAGAAFAYGFTGCPICGKSWGLWGAANASFDDPGHVKCAGGHRLPDAQHPDEGTGYVGPDKRIHYFVGSYNAWVVETLTFKAAENLAYAYSLTGDEKYAAKAAVILDALAAVYPACDKGSWDYPSNPPSGRFDRPWYQVARVLVHYVDQYDQIYHSAALDQPSIVNGMTRRANIEKNLLGNGAEYCYKQSLKGGLTNGEADYIRGSLAVGACLNIPKYVMWALDGPFGIRSLVENNVGRDGTYYETSPGYSYHARGLYFTFSEPLVNLTPSVDLYSDAKLRRFYETHNLAQICAGQIPAYGDAAPNTKSVTAPSRPFDRNDYESIERLYARTKDDAASNELAALLRWLKPSEAKGSPSAEHRRWLLFHGRDIPAGDSKLPERFERVVLGSHVMGQKGLAVLRTGAGADAQAVLFRYGPSLTHGHYDDLNYNYYARGYEMTYDIGYSLGSTHTQVGWAHQTASHNLVVVNEKSQLIGGETGGSLLRFASTPLVQYVEADAANSYRAQGVSRYTRALALIGTGADAYLLDVFRVKGGKQHDWLFHSLGDDAKFAGVEFGAVQSGSLAGAEIDWFAKQLNDGDMKGYANKPYWNPPPGNGYGFLASPRFAKPAGAWSTDWTIAPAAHLRVALAATPGAEALTASAPGLYPHFPKTRAIGLRRRGDNLESSFIAAVEPYGAKASIEKVERISANAVAVHRAGGVVDYASFEKGFALARFENGKLKAATLNGASSLNAMGWSITASTAGWNGAIANIDAASHMITTLAALPADGSLNGATIIFSNPKYSRGTAYRIERIEAQGSLRKVYLDGGFTLGKGQIGKITGAKTFTSVIPHDYVRSLGRGDSGYFRGKRIRTESGSTARVESIVHGTEMALTVDSSEGLRDGDVFYYEDLTAGDTFEIPAVISIAANADGTWKVTGPAKATVRQR